MFGIIYSSTTTAHTASGRYLFITHSKISSYYHSRFDLPAGPDPLR